VHTKRGIFVVSFCHNFKCCTLAFGSNPTPLNIQIFWYACVQNILSKLCFYTHSILNFVQENVKKCMLISHFASASGGRIKSPRPPVMWTPFIGKSRVRLWCCILNGAAIASDIDGLKLLTFGVDPRGGSRNLRKGAGPSRSLPLPFFSPFPLSLSSLLLEIGPLKPAIGSGERCKLSQWGRKRIWWTLKLPESHYFDHPCSV